MMIGVGSLRTKVRGVLGYVELNRAHIGVFCRDQTKAAVHKDSLRVQGPK